MRSSTLVAVLVLVLAAGCGQETSEPGAQDTETGPPKITTKPMPDPPAPNENRTHLDCAGVTVMQIDHFSDVGGNPDPVKAARAQLGKKVRSDDVVERADSGGKTLVRVVRGGEFVAVVHLMSADGGWLVDQVEMCPDFAQ